MKEKKDRGILIIVISMVFILYSCVKVCVGAILDPDDSFPYPYPVLLSCSAKTVEMPEGYERSDAPWFSEEPEEDMGYQIIQVTYELTNNVNTTISRPTDYFFNYYVNEDGYMERLYALELTDEKDSRSYADTIILPPGEHMIYTEYVEVPAGYTELYVSYMVTGEKEQEERLIKIS